MPDFHFSQHITLTFLYLAIKLGLIHFVNSYYSINNPASLPMAALHGNNQKALIVDDEVDICYLLKAILRHRNIQADYVTSLGEADEYLQSHDPSIIFLDNRLNDGLGINYIRNFKHEHPHTWIVMVTAHDNSTDREKAYSEGADFFIGKPFTKNKILETIQYISS